MDFYVILGLGPGASSAEIKRAYRRLSRLYHPGVNPGDRQAQAVFERVTQAYETLSVPTRRRDYDAAVMAGGFCGFMLGTSANAMANMGAIVERYGPAPKAYLVVPLVGAFFIDFANALLITFFLNLWR